LTFVFSILTVQQTTRLSHLSILKSNVTMSKNRQYYLDWIRVLAFGILIFYHSGMFFVPWEFHFKNNEIIDWIKYPMLFFNQWRLSLLFFISGVGISFALKSRTGWAFVRERNRRLLLPLIFGMLVVIPPQIYCERVINHQFIGSYFDFYPSVFEFVPYPRGSFSWHHLWFIVYLWVFSVVGTPIFLALRSEGGRRFLQKFYQIYIHPIKIYWMMLPFMILFWTLDKISPTTHNLVHDWLNLFNSFLLVLLGYILGQNPNFWAMLETNRKAYLWASIVFGASMYLFVHYPVFPIENDDLDFFVEGVVTRINAFSVILCIGGYAKHYLNRTNSFLVYANEAVYPFYILHQTILLIIGFYIVNLPWAWEIKLIILMIGTFLGSLLIYHFLIRPFNLMRLLFGVKTK
jgi:glucans biosynthesis protein C